MSKFYKCKCGSESFIRMYNVYNIEVIVKITENDDGEELWDEQVIGKEKDHLVGYICMGCRQDAQELNDGL